MRPLQGVTGKCQKVVVTVEMVVVMIIVPLGVVVVVGCDGDAVVFIGAVVGMKLTCDFLRVPSLRRKQWGRRRLSCLSLFVFFPLWFSFITTATIIVAVPCRQNGSRRNVVVDVQGISKDTCHVSILMLLVLLLRLVVSLSLSLSFPTRVFNFQIGGSVDRKVVNVVALVGGCRDFCSRRIYCFVRKRMEFFKTSDTTSSPPFSGIRRHSFRSVSFVRERKRGFHHFSLVRHCLHTHAQHCVTENDQVLSLFGCYDILSVDLSNTTYHILILLVGFGGVVKFENPLKPTQGQGQVGECPL